MAIKIIKKIRSNIAEGSQDVEQKEKSPLETAAENATSSHLSPLTIPSDLSKAANCAYFSEDLDAEMSTENVRKRWAEEGRYRVGYGCPPLEHRFREGRPSANPLGRPRKPADGPPTMANYSLKVLGLSL